MKSSSKMSSPGALQTSANAYNRAATRGRVKPIVLDGKYVLGLDAATELRIADHPLMRDTVTNTDELLKAAGFDADEIEYLRVTQIDEIPRCAAHEKIPGWTRAKVDRIARSVKSKIGGAPLPGRIELVGGNSIMPEFEERLPSGHLVWALAPVASSRAFVEEIANARARSMPIGISSLRKPEDSRQFIRGLRAMKRRQFETGDNHVYGITDGEIKALAASAEMMEQSRMAYGNVLVTEGGGIAAADLERRQILEKEFAAAEPFYTAANHIMLQIDQAFRKTFPSEANRAMHGILREELAKFEDALRAIGRHGSPVLRVAAVTVAQGAADVDRRGPFGQTRTGLMQIPLIQDDWQINPLMLVLRASAANILNALRRLLGLVSWAAPELRAAA